MPSSFPGFPKELPAFLKRLAANNSKDWFENHRDTYTQVYFEPAKAFVAAIAPLLAEWDDGIRADAKLNGSIRRIHRDTRFSKDKRPYQARLHLIFWQGKKPTGAPGFHFLIGPDHMGLGAGFWAFDKTELERYRRAITGDQSLAALRSALEAATVGGYWLDPPALKRLPAGYGDADPDLIRQKGLVVRRDVPLPAELYDARAVDYVRGRFEALVPLHRWIVENVTG